eukprot:TRINITY_DN45163_c0_g1_i1.p1 TRINITY_DN45163_c0_g1~~TRINITY_DN45163_c0_g1_i1.p1  ORF type:complete len:559 (-),score=122.72 TRINITY_DN45163_c0_g1_i1:80-1756(-)
MGCRAAKQAIKVHVDCGSPVVQDTPEKASVNNEDIRDKYAIGELLGSGSFGQVREVVVKDCLSGEVRAVKMIERDNEDGEWSNQAIFVREVGLLQQMMHDNIIRYYDFYEDVHFLYVVMELCHGGEVFAKIVELKRFSEMNAVLLSKQMLAAVDYIHRLNIVHRDLKAENFMLAEPCITGKVKMIDFGMASKFEDGQVFNELCGSPHYLAPELIGQKYNEKADVWALGVLLYLLVYGHYPYDAKHPRDIMVKILTEPIRWQTKAKLSKNGLAFMKRLLEHDPQKRMSAGQALEHDWMSAASGLSEGELLPQEELSNTHKKVTATRKTVDPQVEDTRNKKLDAINKDFCMGIRQGKRLGETPKEDFMSKPEFLRRENKITTAPSGHLRKRRGSLAKVMAGLNGVLRNSIKEHQTQGVVPGGMECIKEGDNAARIATVSDQNDAPSKPKMPRAGTRSASVCTGAILPRRLSYIGVLSSQEETNLKSLWEEKKRIKQAVGVVLEPASAGQPGGFVAEFPEAGENVNAAIDVLAECKRDEEENIESPPGSEKQNSKAWIELS